MNKAYKEFISRRCDEIISGNTDLKALQDNILKTIQTIKETLSPNEFTLFCEYESQINNMRAIENRCIYAQARKDNL